MTTQDSLGHPDNVGSTALLPRMTVILVEPEDNRNIGSVARVMKNTGSSRLILVRPPEYDRDEARKTACWAEDIVESAVCTDSLDDALATSQLSIAFTGQAGKRRVGLRSFTELTELVSNPRLDSVALVFGCESSGLRRIDSDRCHCAMTIPSSSEQPSYNLSHAVLLVLFQIFGCFAPKRVMEPSASISNMRRLEEKLLKLGYRTGFFGKGSPSHMPPRLVNLLRRMQPTQTELSSLEGYFSKLERALDGMFPLIDSDPTRTDASAGELEQRTVRKPEE